MSIDGHINSLAAKHINLEKAILDETQRPIPDNIRLSRLKRQKLKLKEEIERAAHN